jgi:hypothetical protein
MIPITDSGTNMILNTGVQMDILDNIGILLIATGFMLIRIPIMLIVGTITDTLGIVLRNSTLL